MLCPIEPKLGQLKSHTQNKREHVKKKKNDRNNENFILQYK